MTIDQELEAKILRYHFVERWGVHTIAAQLGKHHSTVDRVLSQAGLPKVERAMMMREHGMEMPFDELVEVKFEEMRYLEKSIGKTGLLAIDPFLEINSRDLWHLNTLQDSH